MSDLGVIGQPALTNESWFKQLAQEQSSLTIVQDKKELTTCSGVIIPLTEKEKLPVVVDWLRICQSNPHLFVWIFSTIPLDYEQELLMELGTNEVITDETQIHRLSLIVKNTFQRIKETTNTSSKPSKQLVINKRNHSVLVNGIEQMLTKKEYTLLTTLYQKENEFVSYEDLLAMICPNNQNANLYTLTNSIFHLRNKLKGSEAFYIKNIRDRGYMLSSGK